MRINNTKIKISLDKVLFLALFIISENYFGLKHISSYKSLFIVLLSTLIIFNNFRSYKSFVDIDKWCIIMVLVVIGSIVNSIIGGIETPIQSFYHNCSYIMVLLVLWINSKRKINIVAFIVKMIKVLSLILSFILLIQAVLSKSNIYFFTKETLSIRNDNVRILAGGWLLCFGCILYLYDVFLKRIIHYAVKALVIFMAIMIVNQSRSLLFALLIVLFFMILNFSKSILKDNILSKFVLFIVEFCIILIILFLVYIMFMESYSINEASSVIRIKEYEYYWKQLKQYPVWGMSHHDGNYITAPDYLGVVRYGYAVNDIGIIGYAAEFGFLGLVLSIMIIYKFIRNIAHNNAGYYIIIFVVAISPFNYLFYNEFIIYVSVIWAIICYYKQGDIR